jgi:hypothetical protein
MNHTRGRFFVAGDCVSTYVRGTADFWRRRRTSTSLCGSVDPSAAACRIVTVLICEQAGMVGGGAKPHHHKSTSTDVRINIMHARVLHASVLASRQPRGQPGRRCPLYLDLSTSSISSLEVCLCYVHRWRRCVYMHSPSGDDLQKQAKGEEKILPCLPALSSTQTHVCVRV